MDETKTQAYSGAATGGNKTQVYGNDFGSAAPMGPDAATRVLNGVGGNTGPGSRTEFGDEEFAPGAPIPQGGQPTFRTTRKLVGWLVSYTLDAMGIDFKLYEGRNIIGRDMDCNITVNDNMVSSKHAVLLYRSGKYSLTDQQSSHGTFVNGQDIELDPCYLSDGDEIVVGRTSFKFRTSF